MKLYLNKIYDSEMYSKISWCLEANAMNNSTVNT